MSAPIPAASPSRLSKAVALEDDPQWYKDAVIYQVHLKSYFDGNNDGIGDFGGLLQKLDYIQELGVNTIWVLPFYPSPLRDDGYDISDYYGINPIYGTKREFRQVVKEIHKRGMRLITELVINHTSDQHPWFQKSRSSKPGSKYRDYYVWNDNDKKYRQARIIFTDSEPSNWSWDPVAKAYYWHRFFHHQPDLNYDNPAVLEDVLKVMRYWLDMGVDGLRLDAIPYLIEREGTICENLPETHTILKKFRSAMDEFKPQRLFLAEANQWPEDVRPYFGDGDECHMAFHFPIMPRMFMAVRQEDRHSITEILEQTPDIPEQCQWAIFLRNHDELTLEMVTDAERDYMNGEYASDPRMRINVGIRRRLAPLLDNSRRRIELLNSLLLSFPGTPIIYYGDEIGMGDNIYLGDRNGVRTPMQWTGDRNAGFSQADSARLYSPVVMDPVYGYQAVNVEAQSRNPSSLLNWTRRMLHLRSGYRSFSRGTFELLQPQNRRILAYVRRHEDEVILCVANLSRFVQPVELDLEEFNGLFPVEVVGRVTFPQIDSEPYRLSLGPHSFFWFELKAEPEVIAVQSLPAPFPEESIEDIPTITYKGKWTELFEDAGRKSIEKRLSAFLRRQRWFGGKSRKIRSARIAEWGSLATKPHLYVTLVEVRFVDGGSDRYFLPLALAPIEQKEEIFKQNSRSVLAVIEGSRGDVVLYDSVMSKPACREFLDLIRTDRRCQTTYGAIAGAASTKIKEKGKEVKLMGAEQSNSSFILDGSLVMKLFRRIEEGINPDYEIGKFLSEKTEFKKVPRLVGALEYIGEAKEPVTVGMLQELVQNQGDGWEHAIGFVRRYFEQTLSYNADELKGVSIPETLWDTCGAELGEIERSLLDSYYVMAGLLGKRTAELHCALASGTDIESFAPETMTDKDRKKLWKNMESEIGKAEKYLARHGKDLSESVQEKAVSVGKRLPELKKYLAKMAERDVELKKIRVHGDYHLGQVLISESDYYILDFEGEPSRSLLERRAQQCALKDVAGMLRSYSYAAYAGLFAHIHSDRELYQKLLPWARFWQNWISGAFLTAYFDVAKGQEFIPESMDDVRLILEFFLAEKALYELSYEINNRPDWVEIPLEGIDMILP